MWLGITLLAHGNVDPSLATAAFQTGLALAAALVIGCALAGVMITRANQGRARLETALAVIAIMVLPALLFGTLEGEQAGLVLAALAGIGIASLAARIAARRYKSQFTLNG